MLLVGDREDNTKCVPFVSQYSDCTEANMCSGCTRCRCTEHGVWSCQDIVSCPDEYEDEDNPGEDSIYSAVDVLFSEVQKRNQEKMQNKRYVPKPSDEQDILLASDIARYQEDFGTYLERQKRSLNENTESSHSQNSTVKYHNTVDEINEDTLRNTNQSGTIEAHKVNPNLKTSKRRGAPESINKTELSSLHIEYNAPQDYEHQFANNKIDEYPHDENTLAVNQKLQGFIGNYSQSTKDKTLSKIVVNELSKGKEIIGDKDVIPMSNITFTPENDTLTAMAFIAGNLLNKLWNMEKESSDSLETETLKHEKINDLLELFKEPLNLRQETFLKNALEKLSNTLNDNKNIHNVSICETLSESIDMTKEEDNTPYAIPSSAKCNKTENVSNSQAPQNKSLDVVKKLTDVLNLIKKFENTQSALNNLKNQIHTIQNESVETNTSEKNKFHLFATILEKITKLLLPSKHSHRIRKKMSKLNQLADDETFKINVKQNGKIDLRNMSITSKDKIILDYVNHIQSNPNCLLSKISQQSSASISLKGEIIDNLKEFFKIQSLMDISKLVESKNKQTTTSTTTTTVQPTTVTTKVYDILRKSDYKKIQTKVVAPKLESAKEKLKMHLQSIINDLAELQNEHGSSTNKKLNLTDLLPCLGNILKDNIKAPNSPMKEEMRSPIENIETLIEALKLEFTSPFPTRRTGSIDSLRSTSAKVWKRVIANVNSLRKQSRRSFNANEPKTYDDLKNLIERVEKLSNSYKNVALLSVIPPHKKLMLLKTLEAGLAKHKNVLYNIKDSFDTVQKVSQDKRKDIFEFIDNTATNVKLSTKVVLNIDKNKPKMSTKLSVGKTLVDGKLNTKKRYKLADEINTAPNKVSISKVNKDFKLTREQIINQLIINRIQLYLKLKEEEGLSPDDMNYNIGKRALFNLRNGNKELGKELFNILVQNKKLEGLNQTRRMMSTKTGRKETKGSFLYSLKEPLLKIREPDAKSRDRTQDLIFVK